MNTITSEKKLEKTSYGIFKNKGNKLRSAQVKIDPNAIAGTPNIDAAAVIKELENSEILRDKNNLETVKFKTKLSLTDLTQISLEIEFWKDGIALFSEKFYEIFCASKKALGIVARKNQDDCWEYQLKLDSEVKEVVFSGSYNNVTKKTEPIKIKLA